MCIVNYIKNKDEINFSELLKKHCLVHFHLFFSIF